MVQTPKRGEDMDKVEEPIRWRTICNWTCHTGQRRILQEGKCSGHISWHLSPAPGWWQGSLKHRRKSRRLPQKASRGIYKQTRRDQPHLRQQIEVGHHQCHHPHRNTHLNCQRRKFARQRGVKIRVGSSGRHRFHIIRSRRPQDTSATT